LKGIRVNGKLLYFPDRLSRFGYKIIHPRKEDPPQAEGRRAVMHRDGNYRLDLLAHLQRLSHRNRESAPHWQEQYIHLADIRNLLRAEQVAQIA
jgi:hypothetical protein